MRNFAQYLHTAGQDLLIKGDHTPCVSEPGFPAPATKALAAASTNRKPRSGSSCSTSGHFARIVAVVDGPVGRASIHRQANITTGSAGLAAG